MNILSRHAHYIIDVIGFSGDGFLSLVLSSLHLFLGNANTVNQILAFQPLTTTKYNGPPKAKHLCDDICIDSSHQVASIDTNFVGEERIYMSFDGMERSFSSLRLSSFPCLYLLPRLKRHS
jgi:hypothetical protein